MLFICTAHNDCSTACAKLRKEYDKLIHVPVEHLLPSLYARGVVDSNQKKIAEAKLLDTEKMSYVLDLIIDSLKAGIPVKYNHFLEVMRDSEDPVANKSVKALGKIIAIVILELVVHNII